LELILQGQVEAAAIDSTVLAAWLDQQPALGEHLRIIATLGPSSYPPWAIHTQVPQPVRNSLRQLLANMHNDPAGRAVLQLGHYARFAPLHDHDYDDIRQMAEAAEGVTW
jgi:phosphonate transport system substrate-binding protein